MPRFAILTFERFNELDSFVALHLFSRLSDRGVEAALVGPAETLTSQNGVQVRGVRPLEWAREADVVLLGSGRGTPDAVVDDGLMSRIVLEPSRQGVGSQCSGALVLHRLGMIQGMSVCTDAVTRPILEQRGVQVLDQPLATTGNVATAGGCLSSIYLASWAVVRTLGWEAAQETLRTIAPVGEETSLIERARHVLNAAGESA